MDPTFGEHAALPDHYATLEVPVDVGPAELRRAWRTLARRLHPDRGGDPARFAAATEAHRVLSDPARRAAYDLERRLAHADTYTDTDPGPDPAGSGPHRPTGPGPHPPFGAPLTGPAPVFPPSPPAPGPARPGPDPVGEPLVATQRQTRGPAASPHRSAALAAAGPLLWVLTWRAGLAGPFAAAALRWLWLPLLVALAATEATTWRAATTPARWRAPLTAAWLTAWTVLGHPGPLWALPPLTAATVAAYQHRRRTRPGLGRAPAQALDPRI